MRAHHTRYQDEWISIEKRCAERLLACTDGARAQPVRIGYIGRINDMSTGRVQCDLEQRVGHGIEHIEALVNRDFQNRRGWVEGGIDHTSSRR